MRTNPDYILRKIADNIVLIPVGEASQRLNGLIHLTETAAYIWEQVDQAKDLEAVIEAVLDEFETDRETAERDVYGFIGELYVRDMIFDVPELEAMRREHENECEHEDECEHENKHEH